MPRMNFALKFQNREAPGWLDALSLALLSVSIQGPQEWLEGSSELGLKFLNVCNASRVPGQLVGSQMSVMNPSRPCSGSLEHEP